MFSPINFQALQKHTIHTHRTHTWTGLVYGQLGSWQIMKTFSISMANFRKFLNGDYCWPFLRWRFSRNYIETDCLNVSRFFFSFRAISLQFYDHFAVLAAFEEFSCLHFSTIIGNGQYINGYFSCKMPNVVYNKINDKSSPFSCE